TCGDHHEKDTGRRLQSPLPKRHEGRSGNSGTRCRYEAGHATREDHSSRNRERRAIRVHGWRIRDCWRYRIAARSAETLEGHEKVILLDTHALIWFASEPARLSANARQSINTAYQRGGIAISAITLWELAWLAIHGRISFPGNPEVFVERVSAHTIVRPITAR